MSFLLLPGQWKAEIVAGGGRDLGFWVHEEPHGAVGLLCTLWWGRSSHQETLLYSKRYQNLYPRVGLLGQLLEAGSDGSECSSWWVKHDDFWMRRRELPKIRHLGLADCTNACLTVYWKLICFLPRVIPSLKWAFLPRICIFQLMLWIAPNIMSISTVCVHNTQVGERTRQIAFLCSTCIASLAGLSWVFKLGVFN